ncbi:hypothetical protein DRO30_01360 [Candidatus Bathyarchaeota archaeon]|nr:MAG: hypothetical protein DRO30_01360 [Candidatus Bathyarchaeota archaeon]
MFVIKHDTYDKMSFLNIKRQSDRLAQLEREGRKELPTFPPLLQDIYSCLYKIKPAFEKNIPMSAEFNKILIEQMLQTSEYKRLHALTRLDEFSSAMGVVSFGQKILVEIPQEEKERQQKIYELEYKLEDLKVTFQTLKDLFKKSPKSKKLAKQLTKCRKQISQVKKQLSNIPKSKLSKGQLRRLARKACDKAREETEKLQDMLAWGTEPGQLQRLPVEEKIQIAQRIQNSRKLRKIAEIAGRFQRLALHKQQTKVTHGRDEVVDVEMGNDLARVLPSEIVMLTNSKTKLLFYKKFVEKQLSQYKLEGLEKLAKGAVVCCVDNSGSMSGSKEIWSKAVMLGLLTIARHQKRPFAVIHFGSKNECQSWLFPKANPEPHVLLEILEFFFNGGTDFERPLDEAIAVITDKSNPTFQKADVIFITDGECQVSDAFLAQFLTFKKRLEFSVYSILIGGYPDVLYEFSDKVLTLQDLNNDDTVLDTVYQI